MKKIRFACVAAVLSIMLLPIPASASETDVTSLSNEELTALFHDVKSEMISRGLSLAETITLREGKWIVGQDIAPGTYKITCVESDGDKISDSYSALGDIANGLDDSGDLGNLLGTLGGMTGGLINTEIKILGDYGTELKSFEMSSGESTTISLEENTALEISLGTCSLEKTSA